MIKPKRIGHATFETPDLEKAIAYYEKFMGLIVAEREKDRAFLASKVGPLAIQLNKADRAHCIKLSFEVAPGSASAREALMKCQALRPWVCGSGSIGRFMRRAISAAWSA